MSAAVPTRLLALVLAGVLVGLTFLALAGHSAWDGRILVALTPRHGLHAGDLPVLALSVLGLLCCAALWRRR